MIDFAEFFRAAHSGEGDRRGEDTGDPWNPYPWQQRLAERCANDEPPDVIAVPTGAGKTMTVEALVWALAHQADRPAIERTVGVRIVWAIDRRILVDEVYEHACALAARLARGLEDSADPLHEVATRLARLSGGESLTATRWRGGIDDRSDLLPPLQPEIITSTIAQIGSRLLFRGYGVGERSLAIQAGLAACDTTICLDEAHLAEPFRQTVDAICAHRKATETGSVELPGLRSIIVTATPHAGMKDVLRLGDDDREVLTPRLLAPKWARLVEAEGGDGDRTRLLASETLDHLHAGARTVACVVNTVRRAHQVFKALTARLAGDDIDLVLLVGPQRPVDRARLLEQHRDTLFEGKVPTKPLICVATQTFEVGLDADVAAMVTESASATALVQRFGRLNRRGGRTGRATIVRDEGAWLYAEDEPEAWAWLRSRKRPDGTIDVSVAALDGDLERPTPRRLQMAPSLTPEIVDLLAQTAPRPAPWEEPNVEAFLRGVDADPVADVAICWRTDLRPELTDAPADEYRTMLLELVPPQPQELLALSVRSARALLVSLHPGVDRSRAARLSMAAADVESEAVDPQVRDPAEDRAQVPFVVLRRKEPLRGALSGGDAGTVRPSTLRPGDVLVLPATDDELVLGVLPATDVAFDHLSIDGPGPVRITREALKSGVGRAPTEDSWRSIVASCRAAERALSRARETHTRRSIVDALVKGLHEKLPGHPGLDWLTQEGTTNGAQHLALRRVGRVEEDDAALLDELDDDSPEPPDISTDTVDREDELGGGDYPAAAVEPRLEPAWVLVPLSSARLDSHDRTEAMPPPSIDAHARAVSNKLETLIGGIDLQPSIRASLSIAASAHDHGKADPRIQAFYRRGMYALGAIPIAKSEFGTRDPHASKTAARLAGLPRGLRHEIASVAALDHALATGEVAVDGVDADLALHLVGTHHGLGRPIPQVPNGGVRARRFRVDAAGIIGEACGDGSDGWSEGAWLERFWRVIGRYGPWGIAYLEALLVTADRMVSARGS